MEQKQLAEARCTACRVGEPTLTLEEIAQLQLEVTGWSVVERNEIKRLERGIKFKDFAEALAFTNKVGQIAEEEGHHPSLLTEWGKVTVTWWTHKIKGLHRNDFIMAAKTDRLLTVNIPTDPKTEETGLFPKKEKKREVP
jgi:4a-hydroxytetrahydrobiopterin dehydratase